MLLGELKFWVRDPRVGFRLEPHPDIKDRAPCGKGTLEGSGEGFSPGHAWSMHL